MSDHIARLDGAIADLDAARARLGMALVAKANAKADWKRVEAACLDAMRREGVKLSVDEKFIEVRSRRNDEYRDRLVADAEAEAAQEQVRVKQTIVAALRVMVEKS